MARIELRCVTKWFRGERGARVSAVLDLDLTVEPGEFMVLVGPSGSGKTTTLRLIAGLEEPSSGAVLFDGAVMNRRGAHERDVAMVFQRDALYPHMTVYENLSFGLRLRKEPDIDQRVQEMADLLGVRELLDRMPRELSGGQRQRVAVGRALVRRPAVFLFDEPCTHLDGALRGQLRRDIALLQRRLKITTLYVTHDQSEAMVLGDRIAVLDHGRLQQTSTPRELYARPANIVVAAMFGIPPMNLLKGLVMMGGLEVVLVSPNFTATSTRVPATERTRAALKALAGREVVLGVRPEDVAVESPFCEGPAQWKGTVEWLEELGSETIVRVAVEGQGLLARARASDSFQIGATVGVRIDPTRVQFFDAATGKAWLETDA